MKHIYFTILSLCLTHSMYGANIQQQRDWIDQKHYKMHVHFQEVVEADRVQDLRGLQEYEARKEAGHKDAPYIPVTPTGVRDMYDCITEVSKVNPDRALQMFKAHFPHRLPENRIKSAVLFFAIARGYINQVDEEHNEHKKERLRSQAIDMCVRSCMVVPNSLAMRTISRLRLMEKNYDAARYWQGKTLEIMNRLIVGDREDLSAIRAFEKAGLYKQHILKERQDRGDL